MMKDVLEGRLIGYNHRICFSTTSGKITPPPPARPALVGLPVSLTVKSAVCSGRALLDNFAIKVQTGTSCRRGGRKVRYEMSAEVDCGTGFL
jgi:hypothetical protein